MHYILREKEGDRLYLVKTERGLGKTASPEEATVFGSYQETDTFACKIYGFKNRHGIERIEVNGVKDGETLFYVELTSDIVEPTRLEKVTVDKQDEWCLYLSNGKIMDKDEFRSKIAMCDGHIVDAEGLDPLLESHRLHVLADQVRDVPNSNESFWKKLEELLKFEGLV